MEGYNCYVILFDSTHQAISAESALKSAGVKHAVINTPREFTVNCGISLRVSPEDKDAAVACLEGKGVIYAKVEPYSSRWV